MQIIIATILPLMMTISPTQTYSEIHEQAVYECSRGFITESRLEVVEALVEIERTFFFTYDEVPESLRGFLLAAACRESRYNPLAKGDWRRSRRGKRIAMAIGVLQLWPWWIKAYGVDRTSVKRQWIAAWVQTTRGAPVNKTNKYRCYQTPTHYKILKKWIRNIKQDRKDLEDGC